MELSGEYPIRRFEGDGTSSVGDLVVTETRIELDVNDGQLRLAMLCLPRDLEALAAGFFLGEGALRRIEDLEAVQYLPAEQTVTVRGDFDADVLERIHLRWTLGTGCGGGGTSRDMDAPPAAPLGPGPTVRPKRVTELTKEFHGRTELWRRTGGVHACALAGEDGLLILAEDVGRHNAFDKVIGMAALGGVEATDKMMITTGRLTAEIVSKAVACRLPILVSRSAVSSLSIDLARRSGLTLVGFCRGGRMNVYTGYERIHE